MTDESMMNRRTFLKGALAALALVPTGALLSGCAGSSPDQAEPEPEPETEPSEPTETAEAQPEQEAEPTDASAGGVLVAYYSATGNTEGIAGAIAEHLGADTFAITPVQPYTSADIDYNDPDSRTSQERASSDRAIELEQVTPDGFDAYDTVFVGYPIWWGDAAWVVDGFVSGNDFTGKTVIPFCTSGSSSMGSSGESLAALAGTGDWLSGARFSGGASSTEVAAWVDGLGL